MKILLLALILTILTGQVQNREHFCKKDWLIFGTDCILIKATDTMTKATAVSYCLSQGGVRASISSLQMLEFLTIHTAAYNTSKFWVGLTRSYPQRLEWLDGTPITDQPWVDKSNPRSECYVFTGSEVQPAPCYTFQGAICKRSREIYNPVDNCLEGLTNHSFISETSGECVFRTAEASNWRNASTLCTRHGGRFLDVDEVMRDGFSSFHEHKVMMNDGVKYWTNIKMNGTSVHWSSGEVVFNIPFTPGKGDCVTVSFNFTVWATAQLYQSDCKDQAFVICAVPTHLLTTTTSRPLVWRVATPMPQCPPGSNWKTYSGTGHCYWETSFETSRLSWYEAQAYCRGMGAELASFESLEEEKIGLSFQYGSLAHSYWIGLRLDTATDTYKWSDGTPLVYQNWGPGHPDHRDKRLQCVQMSAIDKHWVSSFCGTLGWFVCEAPKRANPPAPHIPARARLTPCSVTNSLLYSTSRGFYSNGFCYKVGPSSKSWHRAKEYCENLDSYLVSIHTEDEVAFLLRMLHEDTSIRGKNVWIGLNSLNSAAFRWADWTPLDFTFWKETNHSDRESPAKCCHMNIGSGFWDKTNCNEEMAFVCKHLRDANVTITVPTTLDPRIGNCHSGWYAHDDRCYLLVGYTEKHRANWTVASESCERYGGYLISIRNRREQAFLSYLLQTLKADAWIGMHERTSSRQYYWLDNTDMRYTHWAPGEPSFFGMQEDCVKMTYNRPDSGVWKDDECDKRLAYICYTIKDPELTKPSYNRGLNCLTPEGWLRLDDMCFKMFAGTPFTWQEAEDACQREGAHLISLSGPPQRAVADYLGSEVNQSYWIGLQYKPSSGKYGWLNQWPVGVSHWDRNEPSSPSDGACFSGTSKGNWKTTPCMEEMPFICQITVGTPPASKHYTGNCPKTTDFWISSEGSYCYIFEKARSDWFMANIRCFRYGSYLLSIHSKEELEMIKKVVDPAIREVFIGLVTNDYEGFHWMDGSPVDFVNWDSDQPEVSKDSCVAMAISTLKWSVVPCTARLPFVCSAKKDQVVDTGPENARYAESPSAGLSAAALSSILVCTILGVLFVILGVIYRPTLGRSRFRNPFRQNSISYENALYNVDSSSMEFQTDAKDSCDSR